MKKYNKMKKTDDGNIENNMQKLSDKIDSSESLNEPVQIKKKAEKENSDEPENSEESDGFDWDDQFGVNNHKNKHKEWRVRNARKVHVFKKIILTAIAAIFAISFLLPTILTMANSFMSSA